MLEKKIINWEHFLMIKEPIYNIQILDEYLYVINPASCRKLVIQIIYLIWL